MVLFILAAALLGVAVLSLAGFLLFGRSDASPVMPTVGATTPPTSVPATSSAPAGG